MAWWYHGAPGIFIAPALSALALAVAWSRRELDEKDDGELVRVVREGVPAAYDVLVRRHSPMVYGLAHRMLGTHDDADDVVQEAFVRAYGALDTFDVERKFSTWLCRIAINLALNLAERRVRRATDSLDARREATGFEPAADAETSAGASETELDDAVRRVLEDLPEGIRAVFILRAYGEFSYDEIAVALEVSRGTVMSRLSRARERLRIALRPFTGTGPDEQDRDDGRKDATTE